MLSRLCNILSKSMKFSIQRTIMTTSAVCYIIYTLTLGVLHERMVSGIGLFVVYCYMVRFLYYPFTYPCVCFLQFYYFSLSSSWVCHVHETRTVWDFVISIVLGANISGESILKHAASDAFIGNRFVFAVSGTYMHIIGVYQEIYIQFSWRYLVMTLNQSRIF